MAPLNAMAIDFETTGLVPGYRNEPWQIGLAPICNGEVGVGLSDSLLNVGDRPFNKFAPGRHAQLRGKIAVAPTLNELWPRLWPRLVGTFLVAHNVGTERTMLASSAPLHVFGPWIDTLSLARAAWPGLGSYALEDLCALFRLDAAVSSRCPGRAPHDALYDAVACALLLLHLLKQPGWETLSAEELAEISRKSRQ